MILIAILFFFIGVWTSEIISFIHNLTVFSKQVTNCDYSIHRVTSNFSNHLFHTCKRYLPDIWENRNRFFKIIHEKDLDDDEDVLGKQYLLVYEDEILKLKYKVNIARFKYYYDKPYKNKKELLLWLDQDAYPEQSYFAKHVKKLTMAILLKILKKKSLA